MVKKSRGWRGCLLAVWTYIIEEILLKKHGLKGFSNELRAFNFTEKIVKN